MIPNKSLVERLSYMNQRSPDGQLSVRGHPLHRPLSVATKDDIDGCFNSGGAGCFATPQDYCRKASLTTMLRLHIELMSPGWLRDLGNTAQ